MLGFTSCPMAHTKPDSSRAMAVTVTFPFLPLAMSLRNRLHSRVCAFQAISRTTLGSFTMISALLDSSEDAAVSLMFANCGSQKPPEIIWGCSALITHGLGNRWAEYAHRGWAYLQKKQYNKAIADYNESITLKPDEAASYFHRGLAFLNTRQYNSAIADDSEAIRLRPTAESFGSRSVAYLFKKQYDKAMSDADDAIRLNPNYALAYLTRSRAEKAMGDIENSQADVTKGQELLKAE